jgi:GrpB-like predicted nucleotidyltransferase (UPF0157 family)
MSVREIVIADYDPSWPTRFERERARIIEACGADAFVSIEHMGSTSVPGLAAKPVIDIMPGMRSLERAAALVAPLEGLGYVYRAEFEQPNEFDEGMPDRRYFQRPEAGDELAVHVHVVEVGGELWERQLLFRDYLRSHPVAAQEYAALKRRLADEYNRTMLPQGIDANVGYTDYKTELVRSIEATARAEAAR